MAMPPFPLAVAIAKARGFDITRIIAREITRDDFERFDVILGMDRRHVGFLRAIAPPDLRGEVHLLLK